MTVRGEIVYPQQYVLLTYKGHGTYTLVAKRNGVVEYRKPGYGLIWPRKPRSQARQKPRELVLGTVYVAPSS